jgi:hypothetical protein
MDLWLRQAVQKQPAGHGDPRAVRWNDRDEVAVRSAGFATLTAGAFTTFVSTTGARRGTIHFA